jgi:hypothetical protein
VSTKFDLMHHALKLAETAKDAMRTDSTPDDSTWDIAVNVLNEAQQMIPDDAIIKNLKLNQKLWVSLRSTMEAVANSLDAAHGAEVRIGLRSRNRRVLRSIRNGY